jgi:Na+/melibiose symporter-like transporter
MFLLPQYLQYVQDRSVVAAGLLLTPLGLGTAIGGRYNARVFAALGPRLTLAGSLVALAGSTSLFLLLGPTTTPAVALVGTGLIGVGLALALAPATAIIMDAVGEQKAGDGGAVNQLARQVGGALGVAIIGSIFAGTYANQIREKLARLPGPQRERATESIDEAGDVIDRLPEPLRDQLIARADDAFDAAARTGFTVCVGVLLVAAVAVALVLAPKRLADPTVVAGTDET